MEDKKIREKIRETQVGKSANLDEKRVVTMLHFLKIFKIICDYFN